MFSNACVSVQMTRRHWFALGGLALASACGRRKGTGYPGYALIATSGENSVAAVDLTSFSLAQTIPLGAAPTAVISAAVPAHSYVLTPSTGSVHLIGGNLRLITSRKLAGELSAVRLSPDGKRLFCISAPGREFLEADATSLTVLRRHKLDAEPAGLDVAKDGSVAVSTGDHGTLHLFTPDGQHTRTQLAGRIGELRFRADGKLLLLANLHDRSLTALAVPNLEIVTDLPLAMQPQNLCFNFDQGQLFISGPGMDGIAIVFPYNTIQVDQTVLAGRDPGVMACSAAPAYLFVASNSGSDVCILDVDTRKLIGIVDVGEQPTYITITPDSQYALVLDKQAGGLGVIRIPSLQANLGDPFKMRYRSGASLFTMIPVGDKPVHAAVMSRMA